MTWNISEYRRGDLVQIRTKEEILATLDENGCIDGMPFMPEMLEYCGRVVPVSAVAHKTCETAQRTWQGRRLDTTVHLEGLRCSGSAHGGCQASCNLFWKDAWLSPITTSQPSRGVTSKDRARCDEERLYAATESTTVEGKTRYSCQATMVTAASSPLKWWDPRQYALDVRTGNWSVLHVLRVLSFAALSAWLRHAPFGWRAIKRLREVVHRRMTGQEVPDFEGVIPYGQQTPTGRLNLRAGERVRIKTKREIEQTLQGIKNRGLSFGVEMSPYCGQVTTVKASVTQIIDELTGEMQHMKQPCITLEGVYCTSQYSECRLMCPRAIPSYWRELWLERVAEEANESAHAHPGIPTASTVAGGDEALASGDASARELNSAGTRS